MSKRLDLTGQRFGRLKAVSHAGTRGIRTRTKSLWRCVCDCGNTVIVQTDNLRGGNTKSCGCFKTRLLRDARLVHGDARTRTTGRAAREYEAWSHMIQRCEDLNLHNYQHYGGRGITICERWRNSYPAFLADMGRRPSPQHSLDRIDPEGHYEPGNCRWATASQQRRNQRPAQRDDDEEE